MCTKTRGGNETSLNTVVHENVKEHGPKCDFFFNFLKFFQKFSSVCIFINRTNLSKFVKFIKIVYNTYLNFIKLSIISKVFWKENTKLYVFYKIYINSIIIYPCLLNIFSMILKFPRKFFRIFLWFFFSKFQEILLKTNTFFTFLLYFSIVLQSLTDILSSFLQIPQIFFLRFTQSFDKITIEFCSNFYSSLLENFLASFRSIFKFFLDLKLFFSNN